MSLRRYANWTTFRVGKTRFIALRDYDENVMVYDDDCQFYGKWMAVDNFKCALKTMGMDRLCLGKNLG